MRQNRREMLRRLIVAVCSLAAVLGCHLRSDKRIYVAGMGIAALDDGVPTWVHPSVEATYATSFEDGSLAVASGKQLEFLKTDGSVDQSFQTDEPIVSPPAITADGSVWVASTEAIYFVR